MDTGLIINIAKTAMVTVVISKMAKAIGEKEIGEIIVCVGFLACGIYIVITLMPLVHGIQDFANKIGDAIHGFNMILDKLMFWK